MINHLVFNGVIKMFHLEPSPRSIEEIHIRSTCFVKERELRKSWLGNNLGFIVGVSLLRKNTPENHARRIYLKTNISIR
jgi:hypothetical protein